MDSIIIIVTMAQTYLWQKKKAINIVWPLKNTMQCIQYKLLRLVFIIINYLTAVTPIHTLLISEETENKITN